jgi:hypothetical protein
MQVMNIVMANNYNDTLRTITNDKNGNTKTVFINSSPNAMTDIIAQLSSLQR